MFDIDIDDPGTWPCGEELLLVSHALSSAAMLHCYRRGLFAMPLDGVRFADGSVADVIGWFSPTPRATLPLDGVRVRRSLRKSAKRYRVSVDMHFDAVVSRCADERREGGWIDADFVACYQELHESGAAHSVEVWDAADRLVGGLFGVSVGGLFAGESMFHDPRYGRDASKVALMALVSLLEPGSGRVLDVQWMTDHLASMGAVDLPREDYVDLLSDAVQLTAPRFVRGELDGSVWREPWAPRSSGDQSRAAASQVS